MEKVFFVGQSLREVKNTERELGKGIYLVDKKSVALLENPSKELKAYKALKSTETAVRVKVFNRGSIAYLNYLMDIYIGNPVPYDIVIACRLATNSLKVIKDFTDKNYHRYMQDRILKEKYRTKKAFDNHKNIQNYEYNEVFEKLEFDDVRQLVILTKQGVDFMEKWNACEVVKVYDDCWNNLNIGISGFNVLKEKIKEKGTEFLGVSNTIYTTNDMQYQITGGIELIFIRGKVVFINNGKQVVKVSYSEYKEEVLI